MLITVKSSHALLSGFVDSFGRTYCCTFASAVVELFLIIPRMCMSLVNLCHLDDQKRGVLDSELESIFLERILSALIHLLFGRSFLSHNYETYLAHHSAIRGAATLYGPGLWAK